MGKKKRQKNKNASGQQQTSQPVQSPQQGKSSQQQHGSQQPQHSGQSQRSQQQQRHALQGRSPKKSHEPRQSQQPHQQFGAPQLAQQSQQQGGISQNIQQSQQSQQTPQTQQSQQQLRVFQLGQQSEQQGNPLQQTQQGRPPQQSQQPHQQLRAPQLGHQSQQQGGQQLQQCQQPQQTQQSQQQLRALQLGQQSQQQSQQAQQTQQPQQQRRSPQQTQQLQQQLRAPRLDQQSQQERTSQQSQQPTPQWFKPQQGQPLPQSPKRQQGASHQERQHRPQEQPQQQHQPLLQQSREECQLATSFPSLQLKETTLQHSEISKTPSQQSTPSRETSVEQDDKLKESTKGQTQKAAQQEMEFETEPESTESGGGDIMAAQSVPTSGPLDLITPKRASSNSRGILGRLTQVETNHLVLNIAKLSPTVHYDVTIEPNKPKKLLRAAMEAFRVMHYPTRYQAFDGTKNLYAASILPFGNEIQGEVEIVEEGRRKTFTVSVKFAAMIDMSVLSRYFTTRDTNAQSALRCLDVALRSGPSLNCLSVGRSFFTKPRIFHDLGEGMEMYYGFYQSAILGWKPFLNVDVVHKAFPKSLQIIDLIKELCPRCDLGSTLSTADFTTVDTFLRMLKVSYQIPNNSSSKRVMRINQLDKTASEATFTDEKGQRMTVAEYFINFKRFRLRYPNLPCAWVGSKQRSQKILFPLELCTLLEGQLTNRTLTPKQTKSMIEYGATSTQVRKEKIMHSIQDAHYNEDPCTREFGLSVSTEFAKVPARILDSPSLKYGADRIVKPRKGVWRATSYKTGKVLSDWGICCLDGTHTAALEKFSRAMFQQGNIVGMSIDRPQFLDSVRLTYRGAVAKKEIETQFRKYVGMQLIVVVIPKDIKYIYNYVKQVSELITGTLTQCVKGPNVVRLKDTTVANILLKVNAKLNGTNHILSLRPPCFARPCMIMGADVTHPSPEARGNTPSVAAVTASQDQFGFQYNFCWRLQPPTNEIIADLANITRQLLRSFYQKNRCAKPERIIFFRDGVSEGQFPIVLNAEVQAIRNACLMLQKDGSFKPKITFLVVQKRHHTRFFPLKREDSDDRNFNVPAGTIVDTEITHPTEFDFYLVSHASVQGVARPTRYRKLWDDANMSEDELEQLTYHLCHMFTRCTRSVSYPAPTYYAHLAAARAKVYCENRQLNMSRLQYEQDSIVIKPEIVSNFPMFFV